MCLNLKDYLFKTSRYNYRSTNMNPMVTINQKPTKTGEKVTQAYHKRKSSNHKGGKLKKRKGTEKNCKNNQKTSNKMAISTHQSIITLNVNGLNALIIIHRGAD